MSVQALACRFNCCQFKAGDCTPLRAGRGNRIGDIITRLLAIPRPRSSALVNLDNSYRRSTHIEGVFLRHFSQSSIEFQYA